MKKENDTSRLAEYFLNSCFTRANVSKLSAYSSKHSMSRTLSEERSAYLQQTEATIAKLKECENIYQVQTLLRKQPIEVQYFIAERAIALSEMGQRHDRLQLDNAELSAALPQKIALLLQQLWEELLRLISQDGLELDTVLSHIFHGRL